MQDIVDKLYVLEQEKKAIDKQIAFFKDQLKENLQNGESVVASNGYTYTYTRQIKNKYSDDAALYLMNETDAVELFVSISDTTLSKAKKAGRLSAYDVATIEGMAEMTYVDVIRSKAPKVGTVLPV